MARTEGFITHSWMIHFVGLELARCRIESSLRTVRRAALSKLSALRFRSIASVSECHSGQSGYDPRTSVTDLLRTSVTRQVGIYAMEEHRADHRKRTFCNLSFREKMTCLKCQFGDY